MELCRICAAPFTRSFAEASSLTKRISRRTSILHQTRRCLSHQLQLHGRRRRQFQQERVQEPMREQKQRLFSQDQRQQKYQPEPSQSSKAPARPKTFKELVELQRRARDSNLGLELPAESGVDGENDADGLSVEKVVDEPSFTPSAWSSRFRLMATTLRNVWIMIRRNVEADKRSEMLKAHSRDRQLQDSHLIMRATTKIMWFHGHPFRGATLISAPALFPHLDLFKDVLPAFAYFIVTLVYVALYWNFCLRKLTRAVWFDPDKEVYLIYMPYRQISPITFKAGHLNEIDDLHANLNIRGIKAYCHKDLFFREEDYYKMLKKR